MLPTSYIAACNTHTHKKGRNPSHKTEETKMTNISQSTNTIPAFGAFPAERGAVGFSGSL